MTKSLRKAIMTRSRLKNRFHKNRSLENWNDFKRQRNICVQLLRKTKKEYFENLDSNKISDSKKFWSTVKPLFSDKGLNNGKMTLFENNEFHSNEADIAEIMNHHFINVTKNLNFKSSVAHCNLDDILEAYQNHLSIGKIKENFSNLRPKFCLETVTCEEVEKEMNDLSSKKSCTLDDIPVKILKDFMNIYLGDLTVIINKCIKEGTFPNDLKLAEVIPIFKKKDFLDKENYRPISILPQMSKVFERLIYKQINQYMSQIFSKYLCGFRKNHSAQHSMIKMLESWKDSLDKGHVIGVLFMDLSKAFDTINHNLLIAKMEAYGFSELTLKMMNSYFSDRFQRTNVNSSYSTWENVLSGVPQGSILGPLFFNIFINDIFFFIDKCKFGNYADDNTLFFSGTNITLVKSQLRVEFNALTKWFYDNYMVLNPGKCHYMSFGNISNDDDIILNEKCIKRSTEQVLLGITIDDKLNFKSHIGSLCRKTGAKLNALARVSNEVTFLQRRLIFKSIIDSQFSYCPLIWMFCSRTSNNSLNHIHERALRLTYNNYFDTYDQLLLISNESTIHKKNLNFLAIEIFKCMNDLSPPIMEDIFKLRNKPYNLRNWQELETLAKKTILYGIESLSYRGPQLWNLIPMEIRNSESLLIFKKSIKKWNDFKCPCRLCQRYIQNIGFI